MKNELEQCRLLIERQLDGYLTESRKYDTLLQSMRYSLTGGGKRIRAAICLKFCEAVCGGMDAALNAACAVEMLHTYSLIHDDLPCVDDDDMRRGKPANHIKYGECTAVLAGDALQAMAFETLAKSDLPPDAIVKMVKIFAEAAGPHGICGGQYLDIFGGVETLSELTEIHELKTAALFTAAAKFGVIAAGGSDAQVKAAEEYARAFGLAFQARDDILDHISTADELGKPTGSDEENDKTTLLTLLGMDKCEQIIRRETERAIAAVSGKFANTDFLIWLAKTMAERKY